METIKITKELITPEIASRLIEKNQFNRRVAKPTVKLYANDMAAGRWMSDTAEMIKISKDGRILDGQHRLLAVIQSGCPIVFHIAHNVNDTVFEVLDTGKKRNATDVFHIAGVKRGNMIPSIISHYNLLERGFRIGAQLYSKGSNSELLNQYYESEQSWQVIARETMNWYNAFARILTPSFIGGTYAHLSNKDGLQATKFINELCTGNNITNNVINLLRSKLMHNKMASRKFSTNHAIALTIKAWNFYMQGKSPAILKFDSEKEKFPTASFK